MSSFCNDQNRKPNDPRSYLVSLVHYGPPKAGCNPVPRLSVFITAWSTFEAGQNARAGYPGYTVVDVVERR